MRIGIVGHAADKFTDETEALAKLKIAEILIDGGLLLRPTAETVVVSGGCHLGGIDIWAEEIGRRNGCTLDIKRPTRLTWSGAGGFKERNLEIAETSDETHVVLVKELPPGYVKPPWYTDYCYHCRKFASSGQADTHVKSGGCWTAHMAKHVFKKPAFWHIIEP